MMTTPRLSAASMKDASASSFSPLNPLVEEAQLQDHMTISRMKLGYGYMCVAMGFLFTALWLLPFLHEPISGEPVGVFFQELTGWSKLPVEICIYATLWLTVLGHLCLLRPPDMYGNRVSCLGVLATWSAGTVLGAWMGMITGGQNEYLWIPYIVVSSLLLVCWVVLAMKSIEVFQKRQQRAQGYAVVGPHTKGYVAMADVQDNSVVNYTAVVEH